MCFLVFFNWENVLFGAEIRRKGAQYGVCGRKNVIFGVFYLGKCKFLRVLHRKMCFLHVKTGFLRVFT
jgi:hypothetical protein